MNKIIWTEEMDAFLIDNCNRMDNKQIADSLGLKLTTTRSRLYHLGCKRMNLEYWTDEQTQTLLNNYQYWGDVELAEFFNTHYPKKKGWTKKHIEKKRKYLGLKRSEEQIEIIHQRNVAQGRFLICPIKRWLATGSAKEGEVRLWHNTTSHPTPMIKINGRFIPWSRWIWEQNFGKIPLGMNVVYHNCNPANFFKEEITIKNLELITNSELAHINSIKSSKGLSDNYVAAILAPGDADARGEIKNYPGLIRLKRQQLLLRRQINASKE